MRRVRRKDTKPEMVVRQLVYSAGGRYRLHRKDLPGSPDLVFPGRRKVIFVHGCFWHRHEGCRFASSPKTRREFWEAKFSRNRERDHKALERLDELGWDSLVIWECETRVSEQLSEIIRNFLNL
jgi:DNA mismatch endonuclease (patch repair protein)